MKAQGAVARAPFMEAFGRWENLKIALIALFGWITGATVIWYSAHFYTLYFLERTLKLDTLTVNVLLVVALAAAAPSFLLVGWLTDKIGRKPMVLAGMAAGAVLLFPLFHLLSEAANPALVQAQRAAPVAVHADPGTCSVQFDPLGRNRFDRSACDIAKAFLTRAGVSYRNEPRASGAPAEIHIGAAILDPPDPGSLSGEERTRAIAAFEDAARAALLQAGYPGSADPARVNKPLIVAIVAFLGLLAAMIYAPAAAYLVEMFPARIRYTSVSLPYHLGVGWVGGFLPASAFAIVAATGDIYAGIWYPVAFTAAAVLIGVFLLPETRGRPID
jgi:MFS family permease